MDNKSSRNISRDSSRINLHNTSSNNLFSIKNNNTVLQIFSCLIIIVIICIALGHYAFKNGMLTCDHYVFNTYLYIILAVLLMFLIVLLNDEFGMFNKLLVWMFAGSSIFKTIMVFIILLTIMIGLTYALRKTPPENLLASNTIWLALIILLGIMIIPSIFVGRMFDIIGMAGLFTVAIVLITGVLGYYFGDKIVTFDWDYYLTYALGAMLVITIVGGYYIASTSPENLSNFIYILSLIFLLIFVLLLLSNHKRLRENSEKCIDGKMIPNYPLESWQLVIKIYNVFQNILRILLRRKSFRK